MRSILEAFSRSWSGLNERERRLVGALGLVLGLLLVVGLVYGSSSLVGEVREESNEIRAVLAEIERSRTKLEAASREREATRAIYQRQLPPLASFVDTRARERHLAVQSVSDQPEETLGQYKRRGVRATLPNVALRPVMELLADIDNAALPIAIDRLQIDHFRPGDQYDVQLGLVAYVPTNQERPATAASRAASATGRAGPPAP